MAYFSNGSEGMVFNEECATCPLGEEPCPVASVQIHYNYKAANNEVATAILNDLVRQNKDFSYVGCQMKRFVLELKGSEQMKINLEQAQCLVDNFGGDEDVEFELHDSNGHSGPGLYITDEYPEHGCIFLGKAGD